MEHTLQQVRSYVEEQKTWPSRGVNAHADALAQSWHRLLSQAHTLDQALRDSYSDLFTAWCAKERWEAARTVGFHQFFRGKQLMEVIAECALLRGEDVQRYIGSKLNDFRATCLDVVMDICDGHVSRTEFEMLDIEEASETVDIELLESLRFDSTQVLLSKVHSFIMEHDRWPSKVTSDLPEERGLALGVEEVRRRRFNCVKKRRKGGMVDYASALTEDQMCAWESLPCRGVFVWWPHHIVVFDAVMEEFERSGGLPVRGPQSSTDALAQKVRRVRMKTLQSGRRRMRLAEQSHWELSFPEIWESRRHKDAYLPADHIQKAEYRRIFERSPGASGMLACELCDFECDVKEVFLQHLQEEHFGVEDGSVPLPVERCEEEYRKRLVFHERHSGWVEMGHGSLYSRHQLLPTVLLHHSIAAFHRSLRC